MIGTCLSDTETITCNYKPPFIEQLLRSTGCWSAAAVTSVSLNRETHLGWTNQLRGEAGNCPQCDIHRYSVCDTFMPWFCLYYYHWFAEDFISYHGIPDIIFDPGTYSTSIAVRWWMMFRAFTDLLHT